MVKHPRLRHDTTRHGRALAEQLIPALCSPGYREAQHVVVEGALFAPTDNPLRKVRIVNAMCSVPQYVLASAYELTFTWDGAAAARAFWVPVVNFDTAGTLNDSVRLTELCPQFIRRQTVGAGHYHQLTVPDQVNAMVDRFLTTGVHARQQAHNAGLPRSRRSAGRSTTSAIDIPAPARGILW